MAERKIYVVGGNIEYANWLCGEIVDRPEHANLCMFSGGEDCDPAIYGKKAHPTTGFNRRRDAAEIAEFKHIQELGLPSLGICRGAQLICCLAGGSLVQDSSHAYTHLIHTSEDEVMACNSTHHQQAYPFDMDDGKYDLLAWAVDKNDKDLSPYKWGESYDDSLLGTRDAEIVYYKDIHALGCQPHPEWLWPAHEDWQKKFVAYCDSLVVKYLGV